MGYFNHRWSNYRTNMQTVNAANSSTISINDPALKGRLETLLANPSLQANTSATSFMKSLYDQFKKKGYLSQKQVDCIVKNEQIYDPANIAKAQTTNPEWDKEYSCEGSSLKKNAFEVALWYKEQFEKNRQPFYYQKTAEKVLNDPNYIPSKTDYDKMVNNKFAERYLRYKQIPAKFKPGDLVKLSHNKASYWAKHSFPHENGLVVNVEPPNKMIKGGYIVEVIATGTDFTFKIEERFLLADRS